jgi:hypothetical protein
MKKIILLCSLCSFIGNLVAQPPKGNAVNETGAWVCINGYDSENTLYDPFGPGKLYPLIAEIGGKTTKPSEKLKEKLLALRKIFMDAYPKPQGYSVLYSIGKLTKQEKENAKANTLYFTLGGSGLKYDGKGGYQKINLMANDQGDMRYSGGLKITINDISPDYVTGLFAKSDLLCKFLETDKTAAIKNVFLLPPSTNFTEESGNGYIKKENIPAEKIGNAADKYIVYRNIQYHKSSDELKTLETHTEKIIMTYNGKLPYEPLTRAEFLIILEAYTKNQKQKAVDYFEQDKAKGNVTANQIKDFNTRLIELDANITTVIKLREIYKNSLDKPATVKPEDKNILNGYLSRYTSGKIGDIRNAIGVFPEKLSNIFIEDKTKGYTACKEVPFYTSTNPEIFQSIVIAWKYQLPAKYNSDYNNHPNNDKRSFTYAIMNNLDWDKIASLLTK